MPRPTPSIRLLNDPPAYARPFAGSSRRIARCWPSSGSATRRSKRPKTIRPALVCKTLVTGAGYPLLLFTLWEGIIAGLVGARGGALPATLTHGLAIFLLSSGLI
jgi:hypothetical protein